MPNTQQGAIDGSALKPGQRRRRKYEQRAAWSAFMDTVQRAHGPEYA